MESKKRLLNLLATLALLGLNLAALNYLIAGWSTARLDLTEDRQFSISPVTERILQSLDDSVIIRGYFSRRTHPKLAPLVPRIEDLLAEYRAVSGGRVQVEITDPGSNENAEQEASARFGVTSTPFRLASKYESGIVNAYFAVVIQHGDQYEKYGFGDLIQVDPLPDGDIDVRLRNLEYDLTRAIKKVVYGFRSAVELFDRVEGPVRLTAILTPGNLPEVFKDVPEAIRGAAAELEEKSGGKFTYEEIDPSAGEDQQQRVIAEFGARPMSLGLFGGDEPFYLYGILQVGDRLERLPLTDSSLSQATVREAVEASLRRQTPGFLKTVGIVTSQPQIPPQLLMQYQMQGMRPPTPPPEFQQLKRFLGQDYQVQDVSLNGEPGVPADVDVLLVLKPRSLGERAVYNLDQYLMRGGRVVLCAGVYDVDFNQDGLRVIPTVTGLEDWLEHIGLSLPKELVLDDRNQSLPIPEIRRTPIGMIRTVRMAPYPYLVEVRDEGLAGSEIGVGLESVGIYWGNPIDVDEEKTKDFNVTEVLRSSEKSWTSSDVSRVGFVDYEVPAEGTEPHTLAVVLEGRFPSFFADKGPPSASASESEDDSTTATTRVALEESTETRLLVVGNAEFLSDLVARALGREDGGFFVENLRFLENAIDWMTLDGDMIDIRSRASAIRRLAPMEQSVEMTLETLNYLLPTLLVVVFGLVRFVRRRNVASLIARPEAEEPPAAPDEAGEEIPATTGEADESGEEQP